MDITFTFPNKRLPVKVYRIGSEMGDGVAVYPPRHHQVDFELIWIQQGAGLHIINDERYQMTANVLYAALPGDEHELYIEPGARGYIVSFNTAYANQVDVDYDITDESYLHNYFSRSPALTLKGDQVELLQPLINLLENESTKEAELGSEILGKCLQLFLLYIRRQIAAVEDRSAMARMNALVKRYFGLLDKDFKTRKNVEEYARELKVTPNYLNLVVKRASGYPANYHIRQRLFQEAKRKAKYSGYSVKEIAYYLNFSDSSHFSKFFKSMCGVSFSEYRQTELKGAA